MCSKERFHDLAYGMFIHYGLYSIYARGEWVMSNERMSCDEYFSVEPQFRHDPEFAENWVRLAADSGMKYAVLTTRHHDGYFIGRDLVSAFCESCRRHGLAVGLYYSVGDWSDPDFRGGTEGAGWKNFVEKTHCQLKELMTGYGKIDYLFYDGCPKPEFWKAAELHAELRKLQPELLISSRCGLDEDVASSEQHAGAHAGLWESCYTLNGSWGYNPFDRDWKTPEEVVKLLTTLRHNGGNLLLNIGPRPDGTVQPEAVAILKRVAEWLKQNGEAVYRVDPHPFEYKEQEISTGRGGAAYLALARDYPGVPRLICGIGNRVKDISILGSGEKIAFEQNADKIRLTGLPDKRKDELLRVLKLEIEGKPFGVHNPMWPENNFRVC